MRPRRDLLALAALPLLIGCPARSEPVAPTGFRIVGVFPHDTAAYTQGLVYLAGDTLLESTGLYGRSQVRRVDAPTGRPIRLVDLPADRFGEGLAHHEGRLFQLTWQSGIAYVYDPATLTLVDSLSYPGEGWGLTTDGASLLMSDGSDSLRVLDPRTFEVRRVVRVRFSTGIPVARLNELEYAAGDLFANVYQSDWILRIDPATGLVRQVLDLSGVLPEYSAARTSENVLNGIAFDPATGRLYVTGKRWPRMFVLELEHPPGTWSGGAGGP